MSTYSLYPVMHEANTFEIFSMLLQIGLDRANNTKTIQQRLNQTEHIKTPTDFLSFVNVNEKCLTQSLKQEKQRVEQEFALIEMLVPNKSKTHLMSFYHLSLKLITQWLPQFQVKVNLSGEFLDIAELYGQFFIASGMNHRLQQIQAIKKNNLYDKIPFMPLLMKWLHEYCRSQFNKLFSSLYGTITQMKSNYKQIVSKPKEEIFSPRVNKMAISRPTSCIINKTRSISNYSIRKTSQVVSKRNNNQAVSKLINLISDVIDIDLTHYDQQTHKKKEQIFSTLWSKNFHVRSTHEKYQQTYGLQKPQISSHFFSTQNKRPASFFKHSFHIDNNNLSLF
ncbi:unnamed protein product (macronuclear) [Paramecium tetraurelia]|uniref:Chromosome undetermined scaffold_1, whole genome shotgun sequence n=1 Tax=Paramecium tetraurelia TaxID=5888 RepID=Q6BFX1_PARTE|nr:hypothetical protein [Paramecium tetraurelia strain d4-2]XP_001423227.1 uncharacterized protein GSPATT00000264001 [Paramecium tetraurelia]CAH03449.1 hypothetical protein PTMB.251c [Paramecium tetraurelia]CAK55829.1 unnamed protein product [Paramecium tetraurelia]|eukprot:XP_001423227.1 hypothetical protein (macronuclear) [Paramecium tetraurelia strain d4-2]